MPRSERAGRDSWNECSRTGSNACCDLPLTTARRRLGTLVFAWKQPSAYDTADLDFLQQVANQVAVAVENALAFQEIAALKDQLARRTPTWKKRSAPSTISGRSSARAPPCCGC